MIKHELGLICFYIAGFGYSDYIVERFKLDGLYYFIYYTFILILGILIYCL